MPKTGGASASDLACRLTERRTGALGIWATEQTLRVQGPKYRVLGPKYYNIPKTLLFGSLDPRNVVNVGRGARAD